MSDERIVLHIPDSRPDAAEPELWATPLQQALGSGVGDVWLYPAVRPGGQRRVVVVDYLGTVQQVTYYGGRAFHHLGQVPSEMRDSIVEACQFVKDEWRRRGQPARPVVTMALWPDESGWTVYVDARDPVTVKVNDEVVHPALTK